MNVKHFYPVILILFLMILGNSLKAQVKIGVFADCQYCDCDESGTRYYRNSLTKLIDCISEFNAIDDVEFVVGLGDLIDRDFVSYEKVNAILKKSKKEVFNVIGNHDFSVEQELIDKVPAKLGLADTYYTFKKNGWNFIFLNGNEITFQTTDKKVEKKAEKMVAKLTAADKPNNQKWNGGISKTQMKWLKKELKKSEKENLKVVLFCHFPIYPNEIHSLWNDDEVLQLINKYNCVKAWINGHNHAGNYVEQNGIHFITMNGMVETESENSFSVITFTLDKIKIDGYGREQNRNLTLR